MFYILFLTLLLVWIRISFAQDRTSPPTFPTLSWVSVTFNRVGSVDTVTGTYIGDAFIQISWVDGRVTDDDIDAGITDSKSNAKIFVPFIEFTNLQFQDLNNPTSWIIYRGPPLWAIDTAIRTRLGGINASQALKLPWINIYARVSGTFFSSFSLVDFPFDSQIVPFEMEARDWSAKELLLLSAPSGFGVTLQSQVILPTVDTEIAPPINSVSSGAILSIPGFTVEKATIDERSRFYTAWASYYSHLRVNIHVTRNSSFYLSKSISNIVLLVVMSLLAALLRPAEANRAMIQLTIFLGIVSWVFVLTNDSPRSQQTTRMDQFINWSFGTCFVLFVYHSTTFLIKERETKVKERRKTALQSTLQSAVSMVSGAARKSMAFSSPPLSPAAIAAAAAAAASRMSTTAGTATMALASANPNKKIEDIQSTKTTSVSLSTTTNSGIGGGVGLTLPSTDTVNVLIEPARPSAPSLLRRFNLPLGKSGRGNTGLAIASTASTISSTDKFDVTNPLAAKTKTNTMTSTTKPSLVRSLTSPPSTSSTPSTSLLQQQQEGMTWDKFVVATQKILFSGIRARDLGVTIAVLVIYAAAAAYTLQANLKKS
jgi:hypothetical protein